MGNLKVEYFQSEDAKTTKENQTSTQVAAEYDNGEIISKKYGKALQRGYLMFASSYNSIFRTTNDVMTLKEKASGSAQESFIDWYIRKGLVSENSKYYSKMMDTSSALDSFIVRVFHNKKALTVGSKFVGLCIFIDDFFDNTLDLEYSIGSTKVNQILENFEKTIINIFMGVYNENEQFESADFPLFKIVYNCYLEVYKDITQLVENFDKKRCYFIKALTHYIRHFQKYPSWRSESTHVCMKRKSGNLPLFELVLLCNGIWLPEDIRSSLLFDMFLESGCSAIILINDVISLKKELACGEEEGNLVFLEMTRNNMTLQDALDYVNNLANASIMDFIEICKLIKEKWPQDEHLGKSVFLYKNLLDESLKYGLDSKRYGDIHYTLKPVKYTY